MNFSKQSIVIKKCVLIALSLVFIQCDNKEVATTVVTGANYFVGIEHGDNQADFLSSAESLSEGTVSPVGNGFEQLAWANYIQGKDQIFSLLGGNLVSYEKVGESDDNGDINYVLKEGSYLTADLGFYAWDVVNASTIVAIGSPWFSAGDKKIYLIDTDAMSITKIVVTPVADDIVDPVSGNTYVSFPTSAKVVGDKLFVSYYYGNQDYTSLNTNQASIAVYSYPELEYIKDISDDRTSSIGRYYSEYGMTKDENNDVYTISSSSFSCGFYPAPTVKSGVLKIKSGESEFDKDYFLDFETISGGHKLNDIYYVGNGKAVVRFVTNDYPTNSEGVITWAVYKPTGDTPVLGFGILDLYSESFTDLSSQIPLSGGGWNGVSAVEGDIAYVGVSNSTYSGVYVIDVNSGTATEGADIDGNYAKGIMYLPSEE